MPKPPGNPPCPHCGGASWKAGLNKKQRRQKYLCRECRRGFSDSTYERRRRDESLKRATRLRRARTLAEFISVLYPKAAKTVARSPILRKMVRQSEYARREGISRQYVSQSIKDGRLFRVRAGGVNWVTKLE
jgi:hypothetical protein